MMQPCGEWEWNNVVEGGECVLKWCSLGESESQHDVEKGESVSENDVALGRVRAKMM